MLSWLFHRAVFPRFGVGLRVDDVETWGGLFRSTLAAGLGLGLVLLLGPWFLRRLGGRLREPMKSDSAHLRLLQAPKEATPTMGGLLVIGAIIAAVLWLGDLRSPLVWAVLIVGIGLAGVGAADDLIKLRSAAKGLAPRHKLAAQIPLATVAAWLLYGYHAALPGGLVVTVPPAGPALSVGAWFVPWGAILIVAWSNAVNLTDGLDGLVAGCLVFAAAAMAAVACVVGQAEWAFSMQATYVPGGLEMLVVAAAMTGSLLAFLRFNRHPARVFLGDTGSLPLGGLLAVIALALRQEILLFVVGAVLVAEAGSVILQVGYYKWRRRRIFLCAPLHHHFQFLGWPERRIVIRFWYAAASCALLGLACFFAGGLGTAAPSGPGRLPASTVSFRPARPNQ